MQNENRYSTVIYLPIIGHIGFEVIDYKESQWYRINGLHKMVCMWEMKGFIDIKLMV